MRFVLKQKFWNGVDIVDGEDPVLILATAVVIDMVCHQDRRRD